MCKTQPVLKSHQGELALALLGSDRHGLLNKVEYNFRDYFGNHS